MSPATSNMIVRTERFGNITNLFRWLGCCMIVLFIIQQGFGQLRSPIDRIGIVDGLSNSSVRCIFQDRRGFMWIGTHDGLNRFDGTAFKIFNKTPGSPNGIRDNWVSAVTQDHLGKLWIGTRLGISIYDPGTDSFSRAMWNTKTTKSAHYINDFVIDIQKAPCGDIFVALRGRGLIRFKSGSYSNAEVIQLNSGETKFDVNDMVCTSKATWVLVENVGLCQYDERQKTLVAKNITFDSATAIAADGDSSLWVAGSGGLAHVSLGSMKSSLPVNMWQNYFSHLPITKLMVTPNEVWIASDGAGVFIFTKATGQVRSISNGSGKFTLSSEAVFSLFQDKESRIWMGTLRGGVNVLDPYKARFKTVEREPGNPKSLINNFIHCLKEFPDNTLWIGTDGGGLSIFHRRTGKFDNYKHLNSNPGSLSGNFITSIESDFKGNIWLSTYDGGIDQFQPRTNTFRHYNTFKEPAHIHVTKFWTIYEDRDHDLWATSVGGGLYLYNRKKDVFEHWDAPYSVLVLLEDAAGQLWGGGGLGLVAIDKRKHKMFAYSAHSGVTSIFEDRNNNFWLGTDNGLVLFDRAKKRIKRVFQTAQGLANNQVVAIQDDRQGNLWISTYNGMSMMQVSTGTFKTYSQADGMQSNEFNFNAGIKLHSGELAFGGIQGLDIFFPESLNQKKKDPELILTGVRINNKVAELVSAYVQKRANDQVTELKVALKEAIFSFDYTAIAYPSANRIRYRFKVEGLDKNWNYAGATRTAIYTNFSPGTYTFRVNCTNSNGIWINKEVLVKIIVLPPWYRTWWAYGFYLIFFVVIVSVYLRHKAKQAHLKYEVKLAKAEAEKEREIHEKRLEFFTGISHEFRTPLTLIINPIKDLLMRPMGENKELNIIYRNARRLLSLVDQLLLFRKAESGIFNMKVSPLNLNSLCMEVYLCFTQQAKSAGIQYSFTASNEDQTVFADREKLEIILFNLISNAIKFTPPGGEVLININNLPSCFEITVSDTGCGIAENARERLFEKFYQSKSSGKPLKAGFGIGLYLVKQFTMAHHGKIDYHTTAEKGTIFNLTLIKGHAHFPQGIISEDDSFESVFLQELKEDSIPDGGVALENAGQFKAENIFVDKKLILLVDDDAQLRSYLKGLMGQLYIVTEAADGEMAMALVKEKQPDLVICDVMMPGMNGLEWCSWLKQDPMLSHIPVILLTGSSSSENRLKGLHGGADDYLSKPLDNEVLMARVANLIAIRNNLRDYFYNEITLQKNDIIISAEYQDFLSRCIKIVEEHIIDPDFGTKRLCAEMGMSHSNLFRKVKSMSGYSISNFIRYIRLRKAAELLINTESNINEVASICGFSSMRYFRTQFSLLFGSNPSDFKRRNRPIFKKGDRVIP